MSPFVVLPVIAGFLWLVHASLDALGHRAAYRYSRWILFGGLMVTAMALFLFAVQAGRAVPPEWEEASLAGVFEGVLAVETLLVLLALALLEIIHVALTQTVKDSRAASQRPDQPATA